EQHGFVLQKVKAVACHTRARLEVDQLVLLAQFDVIERLEQKLTHGRFAASDLAVRRIILAAWSFRVREVGNGCLNRHYFGVELVVLALGGLLGFTQSPPFGHPRFALGRILRLTDAFRNFVRLPIQLLDLLELRSPLGFELNQSIDVSRGIAVSAVLLNELRILEDELTIEHRSRNPNWELAKTIRARCASTLASARRAPRHRKRRGGSGLRRQFGELAPEMRAGANAAMILGQAELFVRAMRVVVVEAPAEE